MTANALQLIRQRLAASSPSVALPTPNEKATNTKANPLGLNEHSDYVSGIRRPDRSTVGPRGNTVSPDQLSVITTATNVGRRDHVAPGGRDER